MTDEISLERDTLQGWLDAGRPITLLDVRPAAERAEWFIPGSLHVDAYDRLKAGDPDALAHIDLPADQPVVTICAAGRTSLIAAEQLRARGLEAQSLAGGMRDWSLAWNTAEVPAPGSAATVLQVRRTGKGCLSYLVGADGIATVIDPSLDPAVYIELARQRGWRIAYVLETHLHADHLSRARQLAEQTGAALALPAAHRVATPFMPLHDGDTLALGAARLTVRETPGHTPESVIYQLDDAALFTGDTLFLAAVGRPDLHADPEGARLKAHALYASLQRLLTLPTETLVQPIRSPLRVETRRQGDREQLSAPSGWLSVSPSPSLPVVNSLRTFGMLTSTAFRKYVASWGRRTNDQRRKQRPLRPSSFVLRPSSEPGRDFRRAQLVLPGHTSTPVAFDHTPIVATLAEVRRATPLLGADEGTFVSTILGRIPPTPPNHAQIIALNEQGASLPADPTELEAGANRCAIA